MTEHSLLFVCNEPDLSEPIAFDLRFRLGAQVLTVMSIEEAMEYGDLDTFSLVLVYLSGFDSPGRVETLLRWTSDGSKLVPVVVLTESYDESTALTLFRSGVADYLSLNDHREKLPGVVHSLVFPWAAVDRGADPDHATRERKAVQGRAVAHFS